MSGWSILGQNSQVLAVHAALLSNGRILLFGGDEHDQGQHDRSQIDHTRLFDCATGTVVAAPSPSSDVFCSGHAFLPNGRLLVAGGTEAFPNEVGGIHNPHFPGLRDTSIYNVYTGVWARVADMNFEPGRNVGGGRWYPTLITLANGRVLAMSGHPNAQDSRHNNTSPEVYSVVPAPAGIWSFLGPNDPTRGVGYYPRLHVLPNGDVLCVTPLANGRVQRLSPSSGTWTDVCAPPADGIYSGYASTSVLLPLLPVDGYRARALLIGAPQPLILDLSAPSPRFQPTGPRTLTGRPYRNHVNAVLLPTGDVFVCGGVTTPGANSDATGVLAAEVYQPGVDGWSTVESAAVVRNYHSVALLMPDGRVWTCGSNHNGAQSFPSPGVDNRELRIEVYEPWYFGQPRPAVSSAPARVAYGQAFNVSTPQSSSISRVAMVRAGSCTHSFNTDQRYVGLSFFDLGGGQLTCTAPPNANVAPPGPYLLFVIDDRGVPSVGVFVRVLAAKLVKEKAEGKDRKDQLKPEIKDLLKPELKEIEKQLIELPGKNVAELVHPQLEQLAEAAAGAIPGLAEIPEPGRTFIRAEERPVVGIGQPVVPDLEDPHGLGIEEPGHDHPHPAAEPPEGGIPTGNDEGDQ